MLNLFDTLSGKLVEFKPLEQGRVKLYACGMTVYDKAHLGHARTTVTVDILVRLLKYLYSDVVYVRNITDVDDKINARAREENLPLAKLTSRIIDQCNDDMLYLGNIRPSYEPKVTEHLEDIISLVEKLIASGNAYISNNHVFFAVDSYSDYGRLSRLDQNELFNAVRIEENTSKKNPLDFVLWKPSLADDDESIKFNSPWGIGRPGWHIECSAMSHRYLGNNFDIHCGGMDLKFPHHENEIAQSRCAFRNSDFAKLWFHIGFLMVDGEKMSKSLKNFITVDELRCRGTAGSVVRLAMLKNHYRKPLNFSWNLITEMENFLKSLHRSIVGIEAKYLVPDEIVDNLCDDLNIPKALATLSEFNKTGELAKLKNAMIFLGIFDEHLLENSHSTMDEKRKAEIESLINDRTRAKDRKDWKQADEIRDRLKSEGITIKDTRDGTIWESAEK
ncbi:MAG: cysteine--tRNA ligase [Rickettsiales bacterium]|jgi:cysteinyl-tRNA synthetase|nr:cysteine--tRNA ligase [Rickettsiales bacterium]